MLRIYPRGKKINLTVTTTMTKMTKERTNVTKLTDAKLPRSEKAGPSAAVLHPL